MGDSIESLSLSGADKELQEFIMLEKQKAQVTQQIHDFNDICWDKCMTKPGSKLDSSTETCMSNCVDRFIDTSLLITQRFAQMLRNKTEDM